MWRGAPSARAPPAPRSARSSPRAPSVGLEVDHQGHALEAEALAQTVLEEERVVAGHQAAVVDLYGEARRPDLELGHVVHPQPASPNRRWLAGGLEVAEKAVELGCGDAAGGAVGQVERLGHQAAQAAARLGRHGDHLRALAQLL